MDHESHLLPKTAGDIGEFDPAAAVHVQIGVLRRISQSAACLIALQDTDHLIA